MNKEHLCYYGAALLKCLWVSASNYFLQPNHVIYIDKWEIKE